MAANAADELYYQMIRGHYQYIDDYYNDNRYVRGAEAPDNYPDYPAPPRRAAAKPKSAAKTKSAARTKRLLIFNFGAMRKTSPLTYIIVLAVAACGICYILSQAALSDLRHGVTALKEELRVRAAENSAVRAAVYERTDTAEIERRAYEMGMTKPAEHQIIRVAASRSSYFNQIADGDAAPQPAGALESVIEGIRSGIAR